MSGSRAYGLRAGMRRGALSQCAPRRHAAGLAGIAALALGAGAPSASAHPHVFIDAGLEVAFDADGRAEELRVVWVFDDFYSMLAISDFGFDPEFTGRLTEEERAELAEIYSNWQPGFEGDLYPERGGVPLALSEPFAFRADYQEGRIIISHRRRLEPPVQPGEIPLVLKVYDPTYYIAYTIAAPPQLSGASSGCVAEVILPDFSYAAEQLQAAINELLAEEGVGFDVEQDFPAVGADFAEEVHVRCDAPS